MTARKGHSHPSQSWGAWGYWQTINPNPHHIQPAMHQEGTTSGSPQLHKAYLIHYYWSLKKTNWNYPTAYRWIKPQISPAKLQLEQHPSLLSKLRASQKELRKIQKEAQGKRQAHLDELLQPASITQDKKKKKLLLLLKCTEELCHCYEMIQSITKPRQSRGLSHIKVPTSNKNGKLGWDSIYEPSKIEMKVLQQY